VSREDIHFDEHLYEAVFESAGDGLVVAGSTSLILRANCRFLSMAGYDRSEIEGVMQWSGVIDGPDLAALAAPGLDGGQALHELHLKRKDGNLLAVAVTVESVGDRGIFTASILDISGKVRATQALRRRDAVLDAINTMAGLFLTAPRWEDVIVGALRHLCEATAVRRVYLFKNSEDPRTGDLLMNGCYEWTRDGSGGAITDPAMQNLSYRDAGVVSWIPILSAGETVFTDIGTAGDGERKNMEALGVKSEVIAPISAGGRWWGFIGFDETEEERYWAGAEIDTLGAAAGIIGSAIRRQETEEAMLAFITESALRLKNPVALVRDNLSMIHEDLSDGTTSKESILDQIRIQIANANQIAENLRMLNASIAEGRQEIPEAFRRFLTK